MSYQTGTATSPINLLQTLVTWLVSIGWTQDMSQADGVGGAGWRAHLHKGTNYVSLRAFVSTETATNIWGGGMTQAGNGLGLYLNTSFNGVNAWNAQLGGPIGSGQTYTVGVGIGLPSGSIQNYYFFADSGGDNVVIVIETTPALYKYLGWGPSPIKAGTWTGGPYFFGSMSGYFSTLTTANNAGATTTSNCPGADADAGSVQNCFVRVDVDTFTGKWLGVSSNTGPAQGYTGKNLASMVAQATGGGSPRTIGPRYSDSLAPTQTWQLNQTSSADSRANLLPIILMATRDTGAFSFIGSLPYVFLTNGVGAGFSNASEYVLGTTTYKMFPNFAVVKQ
jgi:hypothetical protein